MYGILYYLSWNIVDGSGLLKGIIESSIYLIIFSIICFFSIDFVLLNLRVSKASEMAQFIENSIEAYGTKEEDENGHIQLDAKIINTLKDTAQKNGISLEFGEINVVGEHAYIDYTMEYSLSTAMIRLGNKHRYNGIARYYLI